MLNVLKRVVKAAIKKSPEANWNSLCRKLGVRKLTNSTDNSTDNSTEKNKVMPSLLDRPIFAELVANRLQSEKSKILLLGSILETETLRNSLQDHNQDVHSLDWNWSGEIDLPPSQRVVICGVPIEESQWQAVRSLHQKFPGQITTLQELTLPFTVINLAQKKLDYYLKTTEEIAPFYMGNALFGPLAELNKAFPLDGKTAIEFGPFDGCQTAGLVNLGLKQLTCIEARAENLIKTMIARYAFQWQQVHLVMDDFHNVSSSNYGCFDLAFAHGVYYHSQAPFLFLENLLSLSSNVFLGGFCATDLLPEGEFELLQHQGKSYRVKKYEECNNFTAGINSFGYFFHKEDLMKFFQERGCSVQVISDEVSNITAGNFIRFLARKSD